MPTVLCIYVGRPKQSRSNLAYALEHGVWAFTSQHKTRLAARESADLVVIGTTDGDGSPTEPERWMRDSATVYVGRYADKALDSRELVFPDELSERTSHYPHKVFFDTLGHFSIKNMRRRPLPKKIRDGLHASAMERTSPVYVDVTQRVVDTLLDRLRDADDRLNSQVRPRRWASARGGDVVREPAPTGARLVPIEAADVDTFVRQHGVDGATAVRAEARLVRLYAEWLAERTGSQVDDVAMRHEVMVDGQRLYTDLFDIAREELVEAKADTRRTSIRTAVGQLLDYRRHAASRSQAVLVPSKPSADLLALLRDVGLSCIYREGDGFKRIAPSQGAARARRATA